MNNKFFYYLYNILIIIILILYLIYFFDTSFSYTNLCDSGSMTENINNEDLTKWSIMDRIRRKIYWYTIVKNKGNFNSYNEFKITWNPETKVWNEIVLTAKEDLKKSRLDAFNYKRKSEVETNRFMFNIKNTQQTANENRMKRYIDQITKK